MSAQSMMTECYSCVHRKNVPGHVHIACGNPDSDMVGHPHGIKNGWFIYPILFDPTWKKRKCANYKAALNAEPQP